MSRRTTLSRTLILFGVFSVHTVHAAEESAAHANLIGVNPSFEMDNTNATRGSAHSSTCERREDVYEAVHRTQGELAVKTLGARLMPNLRVYWNFEDGSGLNVTDFSGKGNDDAILKVGSLSEQAPSWEPSPLAGGSSSVHMRRQTYMQGPPASSVGMTSSGPRTVQVWFKLYNGESGAFVKYGGNEARHGFHIRLERSRVALDLYATTEFGSTDTMVDGSTGFSPSVYSSDTWHQVVVTYDGRQTSTSMTAYFNGVMTQQGRPSDTPLTDIDQPIYVHHNFGLDIGNAEYYVDEIALLDVAISPADVATLYNHGKGVDLRATTDREQGSAQVSLCVDGPGWRFMQPSGFTSSRVAVVSNGNVNWHGLDSHAGHYYAVLHGVGAYLEKTVHGLQAGNMYTVTFVAAIQPEEETSGATFAFENGGDDAACSRHSDCGLGLFCDATQHCTSCGSITTLSCETVDCIVNTEESSCASCCDNPEIFFHCPTSEFSGLRDHCMHLDSGPSSAGVLALVIDGVETWQSSSLSTSNFETLSASFTAHRSTATIRFEYGSETGRDILIDNLHMEECHDCPSAVAFGALDFIETCSMASDLYITFLGDEHDRSWTAQSGLFTFNLRVCVDTRATITFEANTLTWQGDGTSLCPLEYHDSAYVDDNEWHIPSHCDGPCAMSTYSFEANGFHVPNMCARLDAEMTTASGDKRGVSFIPPSQDNQWQGVINIVNDANTQNVYEVTVVLVCGRPAREVTMHGQPSVSSTGVEFHGTQDYITVSSWDYALDARFTLSFWTQKDDDCQGEGAASRREGLFTHTTQEHFGSDDPMIRIYTRCHNNGDVDHTTWDSSAIGVELIDNAGSWATFAYPLADANDFDTITDVWLHTVISATATGVVTFSDGTRVAADEFVFPPFAHDNLARPDPARFDQRNVLEGLSGFILGGDLYIGAEPTELAGRVINSFSGTLAMLAVDTDAISDTQAACYFQGGEAALSNLELVASDGVRAILTANSVIEYDNVAARASSLDSVITVAGHPLEIYNGRYSVCGIESEAPAYRNANGMYLYRSDQSLLPLGWEIILKTDGDATFAYSSSLWSDTSTLLDAKSDPTAPGNAKYVAYNEQRFDAIKACVGTLNNCLPPHVFDEPLDNAAQLFDSYNRREGVTIEDFTNVFGVEDPRAAKECEPQKPGFNSNCNDGNSVRWGYCANIASEDCQTADDEDADGVIGFGVEGQDCCDTGAGWTNYWASDADIPSGGEDGQKQAWIMVRKFDAATIADQQRSFASAVNDCDDLRDPDGEIREYWSVSFDDLVLGGRCRIADRYVSASEVSIAGSQSRNTLAGLKLLEPAPATGLQLLITDVNGLNRTSLSESWCSAFSTDGVNFVPVCQQFDPVIEVPGGSRYIVFSDIYPAAFHSVRLMRPVQWHFNNDISSYSTYPNGGYFEGSFASSAIHPLFAACANCTGMVARVAVAASAELELEGDGELADILMSNRYAKHTRAAAYAWTLEAYQWIGDESNNQVISANDWSSTDGFVEVSLPFSFPYFGTAMLAVGISSNGFLSFSESALVPVSMYVGGHSCPLPNTGGCSAPGTDGPMTVVHNIIGVLWTDLDPLTGGTVSFASSTVLMAITFESVPFSGTEEVSTFQLVIYPNGDMIVSYETVGDGSDEYGMRPAPVIGFEDSTGSRGSCIASRWDEMPREPTSFRITPLAEPAEVLPELLLVLEALDVGATYNLRLFFYEQVCETSFNILCNGEPIVVSFNPAQVQGQVSAPAAASFVSYTFTSLRPDMSVQLIPSADQACKQPSLSAFTLENIRDDSNLEDLARGLPHEPCQPSDDDDIVVCGHARQTSRDEHENPGLAIDGDTNTQHLGGTCSQTTAMTLPAWWQLDLGEVATVDHVSLYHPTDCCQDRMQGALVIVSVTPDHSHGTVCGELDATAELPEMIACDLVFGQFITVISSRTPFITICEIEVWGIRANSPSIGLQTPATVTGRLTSQSDLHFDGPFSLAVNVAGGAGSEVGSTFFTDEITAERMLDLDNECSFTAGQGVGGAEAHVGKAANADECARLVRARQPRANGATFLRIGGFDCFAEFDMIGTDEDGQWETCLFDSTHSIQSASEDDKFDCPFAVGKGMSDHDQLVGIAETPQACAEMVMSMRPSANGASMPRAGVGSCFAEYGMTNVDAQAEWTTCQFPRHRSCSGIHAEDPTSRSGMYTILAAGQMLPVYCDMTGGDGWTLVMKTAVGTRVSHVGVDRLAGPDGALNSSFSGSLPVGPLAELCSGERKQLPPPTEVTIHVQMVGAGGASGSRLGGAFSADGGRGGIAVGELKIQMPDTGEPLQLLIIAGQAGVPQQSSWNWGGGAPPAGNRYNGGGFAGAGGGASGIWLHSPRRPVPMAGKISATSYSDQFDPDTTLMMAGGGGGGGSASIGRGNRGGSGGGLIGGDGGAPYDTQGSPSGGGTQADGGSNNNGAAQGNERLDNDGRQFAGGVSGSVQGRGGGGGGGWYGGEGGRHAESSMGGGGGGSGYCNPAFCTLETFGVSTGASYGSGGVGDDNPGQDGIVQLSIGDTIHRFEAGQAHIWTYAPSVSLSAQSVSDHNVQVWCKPATTENNPHEWSVRSPGCVLKQHRIVVYPKQSFAQCKAKCVETSGCVAIVYKPRVPNAIVEDICRSTEWHWQDCELVSSADPAGCDGSQDELELHIRPQSSGNLGFVFDNGGGAAVCSHHSDCGLGLFCDSTQQCTSCDSITTLSCDTVDCIGNAEESSCASCCDNPELFAHCPTSEFSGLQNYCAALAQTDGVRNLPAVGRDLQYLGCWQASADASTLALETLQSLSGGASSLLCGNTCDMDYIGLRRDGTCLCGGEPDWSLNTDPAFCDQPCSDDSSAMCGSTSSQRELSFTSVYKIIGCPSGFTEHRTGVCGVCLPGTSTTVLSRFSGNPEIRTDSRMSDEIRFGTGDSLQFGGAGISLPSDYSVQARVKLFDYNRNSLNGSLIGKRPTLQTPSATVSEPGVAVEKWYGLDVGSEINAGGYPGTLSMLTEDSRFPDSPDQVEVLNGLFEIQPGTSQDATNCGRRFRGTFHPPVDGNYTFVVSGDDQTALFFTDVSQWQVEENIASVPGWTNSREWNKYGSQHSSPRRLTAGRGYPLEVQWIQASGSFNLAVGVILPDGSYELPMPIDTFMTMDYDTSTPDAPRRCSVRSCRELASMPEFINRASVGTTPPWDSTKRGSADVCGESDSTLDSFDCVTSTWETALGVCERIGARLCSVSELQNDETRGTGCQFDSKQIWSREECASGHLTCSGSSLTNLMLNAGCQISTTNGKCEPQCSDEQAAVRCCADVDTSTCSGTRAASPTPTWQRSTVESFLLQSQNHVGCFLTDWEELEVQGHPDRTYDGRYTPFAKWSGHSAYYNPAGAYLYSYDTVSAGQSCGPYNCDTCRRTSCELQAGCIWFDGCHRGFEYYDRFEDGTVDEWTVSQLPPTSVYTTNLTAALRSGPHGQTILGGRNVFCTGPRLTRKFNTDFPHTEVKVSLTFYAYGSWDDYHGDSAKVAVGGRVIWSQIFSRRPEGTPAQQHTIAITVPHSSAELEVAVYTTLDQVCEGDAEFGTRTRDEQNNAESWGIGGVHVQIIDEARWLFWSFDDRNQTGQYHLQDESQQRGGRLGPLLSSSSGIQAWDADRWDSPDFGTLQLQYGGSSQSITIVKIATGDIWQSPTTPTIVSSLSACAKHCSSSQYFGVTNFDPPKLIECSSDSNENCNACADEESCLYTAGCSYWSPSPYTAVRCWKELPCETRHHPCRWNNRRNNGCCGLSGSNGGWHGPNGGNLNDCMRQASCMDGYVNVGQFHGIHAQFNFGSRGRCDLTDQTYSCGNTCCVKAESAGQPPEEPPPSTEVSMECRCADELPQTMTPNLDTCTGGSLSIFSRPQNPEWHSVAMVVTNPGERLGRVHHYVDGALVGLTVADTTAGTGSQCTSPSGFLAAVGNTLAGDQPWGALGQLQIRSGGLLTANRDKELGFPVEFSGIDSLAMVAIADGAIVVLGSAVSALGASTSCSACVAGMYDPDSSAQTPCVPCPVGRFNDVVGSIECTFCPAGTETDFATIENGDFEEDTASDDSFQQPYGWAGRVDAQRNWGSMIIRSPSDGLNAAWGNLQRAARAAPNGKQYAVLVGSKAFLEQDITDLAAHSQYELTFSIAKPIALADARSAANVLVSDASPTVQVYINGSSVWGPSTIADDRFEIISVSFEASSETATLRFVNQSPFDNQRASTPPYGLAVLLDAVHVRRSSACRGCAPGMYDHDNDAASPCVACPVGTYSARAGASTCTPCRNGSTLSVAAVSAQQCLDCPAGKYEQVIDGARRCAACKAGSYRGRTDDSKECKQCPFGRTTTHDGIGVQPNDCRASSCSDRFASNYGLIARADLEDCHYDGLALASRTNVYCQATEVQPRLAFAFGRNGLNIPRESDCLALYASAGECRSLEQHGWAVNGMDAFEDCHSNALSSTCDGGLCETCSNVATATYAGFGCSGDCSSSMRLMSLPQGFDTAELTLGMHHDNSACKITVDVGDVTIFSQFHSAEQFTLRFSYAPGDSLSLYQDGSAADGFCMSHLYQLRVLNSPLVNRDCSFIFDRGAGSWPAMPQYLTSGFPLAESGDHTWAWLLSYTPSHALLPQPQSSFVIQGHKSENGTHSFATAQGRMHIRNVVRAVVRYVSIIHQSAHSGGALYMFDAELLVADAEFVGNRAAMHGGAIYSTCQSGCERQKLELSRVTFEDNTAGADGGAIWVSSTHFVALESSLSLNVATDRGGAIYATGNSAIDITNATFLANRARLGAGVCAHGGHETLALNVSIFLAQFQANSLTSELPGTELYIFEPNALKLKQIAFASFDDINSVSIAGRNPAGIGDCHDNPCDEGYYCQYIQYSLSCQRCPDGQIPNAERSGCEQCEAGSEPNAKRSACSPCPPGTVAASGENCHECPEDKVMHAEQTGCFFCPGPMIATHGECRCRPGHYDATNYVLKCSNSCEDATDDNEIVQQLKDNWYEELVPLLHSCLPCPDPDADDACFRCVIGPDGKSSIPMIKPGYGRADFGESKRDFRGAEVVGPAQSLFEIMASAEQPTGQPARTEIYIFPCPIAEMCLGEWFTVDKSVVARADALQVTNDVRISVIDGNAGIDSMADAVGIRKKRELLTAAIGMHYGGSPKQRADLADTPGDVKIQLYDYYTSESTEATAPTVPDKIYDKYRTKDRVVVTDDMIGLLSNAIDMWNQTRVEYICRDGHDANGALCAACLDHTPEEIAAEPRLAALRFVGGTTKMCRSCEGQAVSGNITELLAIMAALTVLLVYLPVKIGQYARVRRKREAEAALGEGYVLVGTEGNEKASPQVYFKIIVSHFQVIMQFPVILSIKFPPPFDAVLESLRILKGDIMGYLDIKCAVAMDMHIEFGLAMLLVPVFCGGLVMAHRIESSEQYRRLQSRWRRRKPNAASQSALGELLDVAGKKGDTKGVENVDDSMLGDMFLNRTFMFLFGVYPFLVTRVIHMLDCTDYKLGPNSQLSWQRYDYSINCVSSTFTVVRFIALLMLFLYPIGIPVFAFWIFHKNRKRLLDRSHHRHSIENDEEPAPAEDRSSTDKTSIWAFLGVDALKAKKPWWHGNRDTFHFMVRDYKSKYYYFEIVEFLRKLCLSGVLMLAEHGSTTQILLGVLLSFMFTTVYIVVRPYADANTNSFRMLVDAALFFTLQCILGIHSGFVGDCELLTVERVGVILVLLNVVMIAVSCGMETIARTLKIARETQLVGIMYRPGDTVQLGSTAADDGTRSSSASSKVYHGVFKSHAKAELRPCVVKVRPLNLDVLDVEEAIMMDCRHPNVVTMFQASDDGYSHYLAMMPCECSIQMAVENGSLVSGVGQAATDRVLDIIKAVIAGVNGLHEADFVHCNIHPSNVLLSLDGVPMLSGFSTATTWNRDAFATIVNTQHTFEGYRAPELIVGRDTSIIVVLNLPQAIDTFSLGCTLFYICSNGEHAFSTDMGIDEQEAAADRIDNAQLTDEARSVISGMVDSNPHARPALSQVLAHPWFWTAKRKVKYLGDVGNLLPVREHKSANPFVAELEDIADRRLGEYNELEPTQGGSWARMLDPKYPLGSTGWGKQQREPAEDERMYHIFGAPPSKKQREQRDKLIAAGKPLGPHEAKQTRMVGLLKMIRNFDAHSAQHIHHERFESEEALYQYLIDPFPWLLMAVYCGDTKHQLTATAADGTGSSAPKLRSTNNTLSHTHTSVGNESVTPVVFEHETTANPMAAFGGGSGGGDGGDDSVGTRTLSDSASIMSGMTLGDNSYDAESAASFAF